MRQSDGASEDRRLQDYQPSYSTFNFPADGVGHFDSLLTTTVNIGDERPSCLEASTAGSLRMREARCWRCTTAEGVTRYNSLWPSS